MTDSFGLFHLEGLFPPQTERLQEHKSMCSKQLCAAECEGIGRLQIVFWIKLAPTVCVALRGTLSALSLLFEFD